MAEEHQTETHIVDTSEDEAGRRLDALLADRLDDISRTRIKSLIQNKSVSLNGATIEDPSYRVKSADRIEITLPPPTAAIPLPQDIPLSVIFEDEDVIVINKPSGLVVHPGAGTPDGTLVNALLHHCGESLSGIGGVIRPGIVHRIDKETTGLMVAAKNDKAHHALAKQFAKHTVVRKYHAVVWGSVVTPSGRIEGDIGRSSGNRKKMAIVKSGGRHAVTHYKVVERFGPPAEAVASLVECSLETGRTHQIRVHMTSIGHPLIGDALYGGHWKSAKKSVSEPVKEALTAFPRQALHAGILGFDHPTKPEACRFEAEYPHDFKSLVDALRSG